MPSPRLPDDAPGTALFPQFESELYQAVAAEVEGLTDQQLDWRSDRWEWSKWSIRQQVSHVPMFNQSWLLRRWGDLLFPGGASELGEAAQYRVSADGAWLDESSYPTTTALLEKVKHSMRLAWHVLARETVSSMREKEVSMPDSPALWRQLANAHSTGIRWHDTDPNLSYITLEATFRHLYYETTTHQYNMQRLKRAQGLTATQKIPREGYWVLPDWDSSEP